MDNIQKSEKLIARFLQKLIDKGLQRSMISFEDLELCDVGIEFFVPCIKWLTDEGIIRAENVTELLNGDARVIDPVLTSSGFRLLGSSVPLGDVEKKLAEAVSDVSNDGKSYSQIGDFFGGLLGGFTKSIGS